MDAFLKSLKDKERELVSILEKTPTFMQLEAIRATITTFESNGIGLTVVSSSPAKSSPIVIPSDYDAESMAWKERILYIIKKLVNAGVSEILKEIMKLEPDKKKDFLIKRVGVTVSQLKKDGKIGVKKVGKSGKYYIVDVNQQA